MIYFKPFCFFYTYWVSAIPEGCLSGVFKSCWQSLICHLCTHCHEAWAIRVPWALTPCPTLHHLNPLRANWGHSCSCFFFFFWKKYVTWELITCMDKNQEVDPGTGVISVPWSNVGWLDRASVLSLPLELDWNEGCHSLSLSCAIKYYPGLVICWERHMPQHHQTHNGNLMKHVWL